MSECSAVSFWNRNNIPSALHVVSSNREVDGRWASERMNNLPLDKWPVAASVVAESLKRFENSEVAITVRWPDAEVADQTYDHSHKARAEDER